MRAGDVDIQVENRGSITIVAVSGSLEISRMNTFKARMDPLFDGDASHHVLFDFEHIDHISSKAIGLLAGYSKARRGGSAVIAFCHVNARIYDILNMLGTASMFHIYETREIALAEMSKGIL